MKEEIKEEIKELKEYKAYVEACWRNKEEQDILLYKLETPLFECLKEKLSNKVFRDKQDMIYIGEVTELSIDEDLGNSDIIVDFTVFHYDEIGLKITNGCRMDIYDIDNLIELSPEDTNTAKENILSLINKKLNKIK